MCKQKIKFCSQICYVYNFNLAQPEHIVATMQNCCFLSLPIHMFQSHCKWAVSIFFYEINIPFLRKSRRSRPVKKNETGEVWTPRLWDHCSKWYSTCVINYGHHTVNSSSKFILVLWSLAMQSTSHLVIWLKESCCCRNCKMWQTGSRYECDTEVLHNTYTAMHRITTFWSTTEAP